MPPTTSPAIVVAGLGKRYGSLRAVDGLTFDVRRGEVFGLLGPNGAGKTTTVEVLEGYRRPDDGSVRVLGLDPWSDGAALRPRIGVMLQEGGLHPALRPPEVLRLFAAYYDDPLDPVGLLALAGLGDVARTPVRRLSGGQRQRLSLACALIGRPEVVFLDEPTAGLDPHARATTWAIVRELHRAGATVLLTTHAMDEAEQLCDRVAIVSGGRLAALGSPSELTAPGTTDDVWFSAPADLDVGALAGALRLPAGSVVEERPGEFLVRAPGTPELVADLACFLRDHGLMLGALQAGRRSLEEVFLQLTAEDRA
jgi:ABC-2 type transport system ATP-binding protein